MANSRISPRGRPRFHTAGTALGRGLRSVLAHHVIFHWNEFGLSYDTQSVLARAAQEVVLGG